MTPDDLEKQRRDVGEILDEAFLIFGERDAKYKGLWSEAGAEDNAFQLRHKAMRVFKVFRDASWDEQGRPLELINKMTEDAFDLINYTAFYIWCMRNDRYFPISIELGDD